MADLDYNIGTIPLDDTKWSAGIGYISIPADHDRDDFIKNCFITGKVSFKTRDGGHYHNCPIDKSKFNDLIFPERWEENGSPVIYVTEPIHQQPMVIGICCFDNEIIDQSENQFRLHKAFENSSVEIIGSAEDESLTFLINGEGNSNLNIRLSSEDDTANMNIDVDGSISVVTLNDIFIQTKTKKTSFVGYGNNSSSISQTPESVNIYTRNFSINEGSEQMVLGNKLKTFLDDFIDELSRTKVATGIGVQPILNSVQVAAFKEKTKELLSKIGSTD